MAYVDYHDSEYVPEEEKIVNEEAEKSGVKLYRKDVFLDWKTSGFEEKARDIRYRWFARLAEEGGYSGVITAHQKNDDAETFLFQKKRQGIVEYPGLCPVSALYGLKVYRPLLYLTKNEVVKMLAADGIGYFDDPTNKNSLRFRDNLRMTILKEDSGVLEALKERDALLPHYEQAMEEVSRFCSGDDFLLSSYRKFSDEIQKRICYRCGKILYPDADGPRLSAVMKLSFDFLKSYKTGRIPLYGGICLYKSKKRFFFALESPLSGDFDVTVERPCVLNHRDFILNLEDPVSIHIKSFPVHIKNVKKGDALNTGIAGKDAYRFLKTHEVPDWIRDRYPGIYGADGRIVYLPMWDDGKNDRLRPTLPSILLPKGGNKY